MDQHSLQYYLDQYITGRITRQEWQSLKQLLNDPANLQLLDQIMEKQWQEGQQEGFECAPVTEGVVASLLSQINEQETAATSVAPIHRIHLLKTAWFRYAAAIIIVAGIGAYLWNLQHKEKPSDTVQTTQPVPLKNDVAAPASTKALLTLADGRQIEIEPAATGSLAREGSTEIEKNANGVITYNSKEQQKNAIVQYNTLSVPRGSQVTSIVLADGSKVFLNAASSLRYPVTFTGNDRRVEITGEAYFEVAKNVRQPFIVKTDKSEITVLGTHFNVNAFPEEAATSITLLEGRVKVQGKSNSLTIKPGEQAVDNGTTLSKNSKVNIDQVMAWKNGLFLTGNEDVELTSFLRQVSRWYDVDIRYEGKVTGSVGGTLPRQVNVSKVLEMLESTGAAKYRIEGNTVIISSAK